MMNAMPMQMPMNTSMPMMPMMSCNGTPLMCCTC